MKNESPNEFVAGKISKNDSEEVRVLASSFKNYRNAHVRQYVTRKDGVVLDEAVPTFKGVSLHLEQLPALIQHLETLCEAEGIELPTTVKAVTS